MAELKTKPTKVSVAKFLDGIKDEERRKDCLELVDVMKKATKSEPVMWERALSGSRYTTSMRADARGLFVLVLPAPNRI